MTAPRLLTSAVVLISAAAAPAADWPQFRGSAGGVAEPGLPLEWGPDKNLAWAADLPGPGWSQPAVSGDKVFVTSAVSDPPIRPKDFAGGVRDPQSRPTGGYDGKAPDAVVDWRLVCLDLATGKVVWDKSVVRGKPKHPIHPSNTYATETPAAADGRVVVYFGATGTLAAFDTDGTERWRAELGAYPTVQGFGTASSPAVRDGRVFVQSFTEKSGFLAAFDLASGNELWRAERKPGSAWGSPFVWANSKRTEVVACGPKRVTSHDPATGAELWRVGGFEGGFAPTPAADGDRLFFGNGGPGSTALLCGVNAGAAGDLTLKAGEASNAGVAWFKAGAGPGLASPVAANGYLYVLNTAGLACHDGASGKLLYKERLPKSKTVAASPILAGGRLYVVDEAGRGYVVTAGPQFEVAAAGKVDDVVWASPAAAAGRLLVRGVDKLYCFK